MKDLHLNYFFTSPIQKYENCSFEWFIIILNSLHQEKSAPTSINKITAAVPWVLLIGLNTPYANSSYKWSQFTIRWISVIFQAFLHVNKLFQDLNWQIRRTAQSDFCLENRSVNKGWEKQQLHLTRSYQNLCFSTNLVTDGYLVKKSGFKEVPPFIFLTE